jgi:hypothetical protein
MDVSERIARTLERAKDPHALDTVTLYGDIGNLMVQYANNESVFYRVLGSLIGDGAAADIVFFSHKNTQGRLELVANLATEKITDPALLKEFRELHSHFKSLGKTRNFYAHARYEMTAEGKPVAAIGVIFDNQSNQFRDKKVEFDRAGRHELAQCGTKFKALNTRLIAFAQRLDDWLLAQSEGQPRLPFSRSYQLLIRPTPRSPRRR